MCCYYRRPAYHNSSHLSEILSSVLYHILHTAIFLYFYLLNFIKNILSSLGSINGPGIALKRDSVVDISIFVSFDFEETSFKTTLFNSFTNLMLDSLKTN